MATKREQLFARIAVRKGFVLQFQADTAMQRATEERATGRAVSLADILVERGYMIPDHVTHVNATLAAYTLHCAACKLKYNVYGIKEGERFRCKGCAAVITVPAIAEPVLAHGPTGSYPVLEALKDDDTVWNFKGGSEAVATEEDLVDLKDDLSDKLKPKAELIDDDDDDKNGTVLWLRPQG